MIVLGDYGQVLSISLDILQLCRLMIDYPVM